mmetsp:Transcript_3349/g.11368  ORF Transcript_3349/g.11368 Transcript_3349/m.11368 type:complete len:201 (-) Transcript_3349:1234-1836(-)
MILSMLFLTPFSSSSSSSSVPSSSSSSSSSSSFAFKSSMDAKNCATILRSISLCALSRFGQIASISSMKTMLGAAAFAARKSCLMFFSESPETPETISVAAMEKKVTLFVLFSIAAFATACATVVLPHPGGPCSKTPLGGGTPSQSYNSGCFRGRSISSSIADNASSTPPKSERETFRGFVACENKFSDLSSRSPSPWKS